MHFYSPMSPCTLTPGSKAPFNWLTQSSLDTFTDFSLPASDTSSSLLFTMGSSGQGSSSKRPIGPGHTGRSGLRGAFVGRIPRPRTASTSAKEEEGQCWSAGRKGASGIKCYRPAGKVGIKCYRLAGKVGIKCYRLACKVGIKCYRLACKVGIKCYRLACKVGIKSQCKVGIKC